MTASERLAALGITLPDVTTPVGSYVPALRHGDLVYTSGQLPMLNGAVMATGTVGVDVSPEDAVECARQAALCAIAAIAQAGGGIDSIARIVKVTGYVAAAPDFTGHPAVVNGASNVLANVFGESGRHARSAVGVASLPLGSPIEVEVIAALRSLDDLGPR